MPFLIPAVAATVAGQVASAGARNDANAARQAGIQQFLNIHVPDIAEQQIELQHFQRTGQFSPKLQATFNQQGSKLNDIQVDPNTRQAQMNALAKMQDITANNGMDAQEKQQVQQVNNAANTNEKGQRDAIVQNAAQRGVGGSGAEFQAQLLASQSDANTAANQGMSAQSLASQRALQALAGTGAMAGTVRSQDYSQAANAATAQDSINRFNAANSQSVEGSNVGTQNAAQLYNQQQDQNTANMNTGLDNQSQMYNKGLYHQNYQDQLQRASGASGQYQAAGNQDNLNATQTGAMWSGIGKAITKGGAAYAQYNNNKKTAGEGEDNSDGNSSDSSAEAEPDKMSLTGT